jgi:hypothetical protein
VSRFQVKVERLAAEGVTVHAMESWWLTRLLIRYGVGGFAFGRRVYLRRERWGRRPGSRRSVTRAREVAAATR